MMKKKILVMVLILCLLTPINASCEMPDGFSKIKCTAYCCGEITANGSKVHEGGLAASKEHMGDVAELYTLEGEFLGYFECNDAGGTDAIRNGYVIDIYRKNYERCVEWMIKTQGKVLVRWIKGKG